MSGAITAVRDKLDSKLKPWPLPNTVGSSITN